MQVFKRRTAEPWDATPAQEEAALRLSAPFGGHVRTFADGTAEFCTLERGGLRRYVIRQNGEATLVESRPAPPEYVSSQRLAPRLMLLSFLAFGLIVLGGEKEWAVLFWLGVIGFFLGFAWLWRAAGTMTPFATPPPGEHWEYIGGPEGD
jgi:hypothetical protein